MQMTIHGVASHTLRPGSVLQRGKVYVFDCMNLLYSMLGVTAIGDLLMQSPAMPTREVVSLSLSLSHTQHTHTHTHTHTGV